MLEIVLYLLVGVWFTRFLPSYGFMTLAMSMIAWPLLAVGILLGKLKA